MCKTHRWAGLFIGILCGVFLFGAAPAGAAPGEIPVRLVVQGAEKPVELRALGIRAELVGRLAWTAVDMEFYNPNGRVLEGELQFPLRGGQTVTGFALETGDGKERSMRDAVPVEKAKGRQVFEEIVRRNVDPALLEVTQGDNFKIRVYPLNPGQTRRVRVTYSERLGLEAGSSDLLYRLPLVYAGQVERFEFTLHGAGASRQPLPPQFLSQLSSRLLSQIQTQSKIKSQIGSPPQIKESGNPPATDSDEEAGSFTVTVLGSDVRMEREIEISIPVPHHASPPDRGAVFLGERDGAAYFYAEVPTEQALRELALPAGNERPKPGRVSILWDASASGRRRDHVREFAFLDTFFTDTRDAAVTLQQVRDAAEPVREFSVKGGDWAALRGALESTVYDGATNLSAFDTEISSDLFLLFSDGLDNYSGSPLSAPGKPFFAFVSAPGADSPRLKGIASRSGGAVVDLLLFDAQAALQEVKGTLSYPSSALRVLSVEGGVSDVVWGPVSRSVPTVAMAGTVRDPSRPLRVTFAGTGGTDGKRFVSEVVPNFNGAPRSGRVPFIWASMRLEELEEEYDLNRGAIRRLGKAFNIATRETSLIVLDSAEDYVLYGVEPPAELKKEYDRLRAAAVKNPAGTGKFQRVLAEWRERQEWWKKEFPKEGKRPVREREAETGGAAGNAGVLRSLRRESPLAESSWPLSGARTVPLTEVPEISAPAPAPHQPEAQSEAQADGSPSPEAGISVALRPWTPDAPYIRRMQEVRDEDLYRVYLDERPDWENSVAFCLDAADRLKQRGQEALSLRVLSNLAEMNLENRQILRILGCRLMGAGKAKQAAVIFEKVLNLGEEEPQSFRDLGLAYAAAGEPQKAVDRLCDVAERDFPRLFPGIEVIALTELNAIITAFPGLDTSRVDQRFLANMPLDLRVVLTWDADNTDIDLHVIDPNGEEVFYSNPLSWQGGRVSPDNTAGYGPEEFALKKAKPGKYRVEVNFYGHRQQILSEATTVQLDFFTRYGTEKQQKQSVTMRLRDARDRIFMGEFDVK